MRNESNYMTCIHQESGLCRECQAEYDADPQAWIEYGNHREGIENWNSIKAEMEQGAAA